MAISFSSADSISRVVLAGSVTEKDFWTGSLLREVQLQGEAGPDCIYLC